MLMVLRGLLIISTVPRNAILGPNGYIESEITLAPTARLGWNAAPTSDDLMRCRYQTSKQWKEQSKQHDRPLRN